MENLNYNVWEHVIGLPEYLDTIAEDLTDSCYEMGYTLDEVEEFITRMAEYPDKYGREHTFYIITY